MGYFVAGEGRRFYGRTTTSAVAAQVGLACAEPRSASPALIVAANTPLPNYAWKVFPALLCGNAAVLKPSEHTPFSAARFVAAAARGGRPRPGSCNSCTGIGPRPARPSSRPDVDVVSFTGSAAVGRRIAASTGARLVKTCLELGGKNPLVVCDDADLERQSRRPACRRSATPASAAPPGSRFIVMDAVYDEFRERLLERIKQLRVGVATDGDLGPVISERQWTRCSTRSGGHASAARSVLTGGDRLTGQRATADGCFLEPTLLENVPCRR